MESETIRDLLAMQIRDGYTSGVDPFPWSLMVPSELDADDLDGWCEAVATYVESGYWAGLAPYYILYCEKLETIEANEIGD